MAYKFPGPGPGRPKGLKNRATKAKEDYFKAYAKLGGLVCLIETLQDKRSRKEFLLRVLPSLMPKNGDGDAQKVLIEYGLSHEMESLMKAMIEARRRIDPAPSERAVDRLECQPRDSVQTE